MEICPVCGIESEIIEHYYGESSQDGEKFSCPKCGKFFIVRTALNIIEQYNTNIEWKAKASFWIRNRQKDDKEVELSTEELKIINDITLPKLKEQIDRFVIWIGDNQNFPEKKVLINPFYFSSVIGTISMDGVRQVVDFLSREKLLEYRAPWTFRLTLDGWNRYDELKRVGIVTKRAFMAMDFKDLEFNRIFRENFKKAVKQTGFDLFRLDERPEAGLIDNRMRVEIRNARFLLSDLSHGNQGAYFEAGFAEGLGKPVIYLCERIPFNDPKRKPHFDTNHQHIIVWDKEDLQKVEEDIKSTIRATLPLEAKMTDDEEST